MTGGMDNPVDVVFTPGGEPIFTTTFFVHPGGGRRDGLIHAIYGGIYGKVHDPIFEPIHKWTAPDVMPVLLDMGPAAPCGLTRYESAAFGEGYRDNLFACYFNLHKVGRHVLTPEGTSFSTRDDDFVTSTDLDFHPTDVLEDADGSLLIVDTGGWYKLCCPTSQLQKPDVLGAIYRVRRNERRRPADPRGLDLPWETLTPARLVKLIDDPRPAVRSRAMRSLAGRGESALPPLTDRLRDATGRMSGEMTSRGPAARRTASGRPAGSTIPAPGAGARRPRRSRPVGPPGICTGGRALARQGGRVEAPQRAEERPAPCGPRIGPGPGAHR